MSPLLRLRKVPKIRLHVRPKLNRVVRTPTALTLALTLAGCALAACSSGPPGGTSSAQCAALMVYGDHWYAGRGGLRRDPATTGRLVTALMPRCATTHPDLYPVGPSHSRCLRHEPGHVHEEITA